MIDETEHNDLDYPPKFVELWEKGAQTPITLHGLSKELALSTRHKLYRLRDKMRKKNHPSVGLANQASITIGPDVSSGEIKGWFLTIYPLTLELDEALAKAGISSHEPPPLE